MSIPDTALLKYILTLDCGHKRRTMNPTNVGASLPCIDQAHYLEKHVITNIYDEQFKQNVDTVGWLTPHAAMLGAYSSLNREADNLPWYAWIKKRNLRKQAKWAGLVGARIGLKRPR